MSFLTMECRIRVLKEGISWNEVKVAISQMKKEKATEMEGIPAEMWKCLGDNGLTCMLWDLMQRIYELPTEWRDSVIIHIYKEKGDIQDRCN